MRLKANSLTAELDKVLDVERRGGGRGVKGGGLLYTNTPEPLTAMSLSDNTTTTWEGPEGEMSFDCPMATKDCVL